MIIDIKKQEHIRTIQKMLNIDEKLAEKIFNEAGIDIEKIYISFKNQKPKLHSEKTYSRCLRCGRPLKTEESKICGYGSICKDKISSSRKSKKRSFISGVKYGIDTNPEGASFQ